MPLKSAKRSGVSSATLVLMLLGSAQQVVDEHFWLNLLLDIQRRCMNNEVAPILLDPSRARRVVRIEVSIPWVVNLSLGSAAPLSSTDLIFGGVGDVLPLGLGVFEHLD